LRVLILLFISVTAWGWTHKPEAGLGYTNNANYEDSNTDSDLYLWLRDFSSHTDKSNFTVWLSYKDYLKESQNDVFNWRGGLNTSASFMHLDTWNVDFGVGGQHFTTSSPGTTEENFGYLFAEMSLIKPIEIGSNAELSLEPGYQIKGYSDLGNRIDHRVFFLANLELELNEQHTLSPYLEVGVIFSSDSLYTRNYFSLGTDWLWTPRTDLQIGAGINLRYTTYPNRTVSTRTIVSGKRNSFRTVSQDESETHSYTQLQSFVVKKISLCDLKGLVYLASQNSKSGFENYTELGARVSAIFTF
jgi:hypothetical protein